MKLHLLGAALALALGGLSLPAAAQIRRAAAHFAYGRHPLHRARRQPGQQ